MGCLIHFKVNLGCCYGIDLLNSDSLPSKTQVQVDSDADTTYLGDFVTLLLCTMFRILEELTSLFQRTLFQVVKRI